MPLDFNIRGFLAKMRGRQAEQSLAKEAIKEALRKHLDLEVPAEDITLSASVATVGRISQAARSALFIKKQAILAEINNEADGSRRRRAVTDIR